MVPLLGHGQRVCAETLTHDPKSSTLSLETLTRDPEVFNPES
jgi:hypothetical protein